MSEMQAALLSHLLGYNWSGHLSSDGSPNIVCLLAIVTGWLHVLRRPQCRDLHCQRLVT